MTKIFPLFTGMILGLLVSLMAYIIWPDAQDDEIKKPLYWVAPMDANYRRDKPGKSPMGMELVPVYDTGTAASDTGTITVSPQVINSLGVRTATVALGRLNQDIKTVGYVQFDQDHRVHVHSRVEGWIEELYVKAAGDPVKKGTPLYDIYAPQLVNAQQEYILALSRKNPRLIRAAEDKLKALRLPASAIVALKKTKKIQQTITFHAPQDGVIAEMNIQEGFFVKPDKTLMAIGSLDQIWVEAEVFARQAAQVAQGQNVTMTLDFWPGRDWPGQVDYIYPTLDMQNRTLRVRLRFDNDRHRLKPGMYAKIILHDENAQERLLVPREAVIRSGDNDRVVLALGDGRFKSVRVRLGRSDDQNMEILSGLTAGEHIVTSAQFLLDSESSKMSDFTRMNAGEKTP